jgi:hypothetical protein
MDRPRILRLLRLSWSTGYGIVCLLLIALWVRTKYTIDSVHGPLSKPAGFGVMSRHGGIGELLTEGNLAWSYYAFPADELVRSEFELQIGYKTALGFVQYMKSPGVFRIRVPYWSLISLSAVFAAIPWLRWRFSLRTLLIATTLIAFVLGAVVYSLR